MSRLAILLVPLIVSACSANLQAGKQAWQDSWDFNAGKIGYKLIESHYVGDGQYLLYSVGRYQWERQCSDIAKRRNGYHNNRVLGIYYYCKNISEDAL